MIASSMKITEDKIESEEVRELVTEHFKDMEVVSPEGSCHALDIDNLRDKDVTFWVVRIGDDLAGCAALKEIDSTHGEIKSMRIVKDFLRRGVGGELLRFIIDVANQRGYQRLSLETGSDEAFVAARGLYSKFGFEECKPFGDYWDDPNCTFMTKAL